LFLAFSMLGTGVLLSDFPVIVKIFSTNIRTKHSKQASTTSTTPLW